jgi:excisionase family DNA binding protein
MCSLLLSITCGTLVTVAIHTRKGPDMNSNSDDWISIAETAQVMKVSTKTVRRYIAQGRITAHRMGPRFIRIDRAEIERTLRPITTIGAGR